MIGTGTFFVHDRGFYRDLLRLAVPMILQNMISFGIALADNLMVGRLGDDAISGLYLGTLVYLVLFLIIAGVESSVLILSAQYWGKHDTGHIKDVVSIGMRIALSIALFFSVAAVFFPGWVIGLLTPDRTVTAIGASYLRIVGTTYLLSAMSQLLIAAMRSVEIVRIG